MTGSDRMCVLLSLFHTPKSVTMHVSSADELMHSFVHNARVGPNVERLPVCRRDFTLARLP